jgi:lysyl-tRNA synthetase class I
MKKVILITGSLIFILTSCGPTQEDALKYNDSLIDITDELTEMQDLFVNQIDGHNVDSLKITHELFVQQSEISSENLAKVKKFEDKNEFGKATSDFIATINSVANNECKKMVELLSKDGEQFTDQDQEKLNILASMMNEKYNKVFKNLQKKQIAFSKEWNFKLNFNR